MLGALGPAHQGRECRQYSRPTHGPYRDPQGPTGASLIPWLPTVPDFPGQSRILNPVSQHRVYVYADWPAI